jgi:hypothetical protein
MSQHQNPFYQLPHEILFSGIYPYLLQSAPFIIENHENNVTKYLYDRYWIRFLNTSKIFMKLKKATRYILLKSPAVVSKFMEEDQFRTYLFSLVDFKNKQIGVHCEDWYRNRPIYGMLKGSFFFPILNDLHYVNLSSVYMDLSNSFPIQNIAYLSLSSLDLNKIAFLGNIISLSLANCYHVDLRVLPISIRILSLFSCDIDHELNTLSKSLEKLDITNCRGLTKPGMESLTYLKSFYFTTSTFRPFNHQNDSRLTEVDFSIYSNIPELKISLYPSIDFKDFKINCFKNVISLTLIASAIPRISDLRCLEYLNIDMKGQESKGII